MQCPIENVAPLLPHSGKMVLLDTVYAYDDNTLSAGATILPDCLLAEDGHFPAWAAMEVMAQGVGALAGIFAVMAGETVKLGFLLGTRKLHLYFERIPAPCRLRVTVCRSIQDTNGFGVCDCELFLEDGQDGGTLLAQAALNVFQPKDASYYLSVADENKS